MAIEHNAAEFDSSGETLKAVIEIGNEYDYSMPNWKAPVRVTIEAGKGDQAEKMFVRFSPDRFPTPLQDIPTNASFVAVASEAEVAAHKSIREQISSQLGEIVRVTFNDGAFYTGVAKELLDKFLGEGDAVRMFCYNHYSATLERIQIGQGCDVQCIPLNTIDSVSRAGISPEEWSANVGEKVRINMNDGSHITGTITEEYNSDYDGARVDNITYFDKAGKEKGHGTWKDIYRYETCSLEEI